MQAGAEMKFDGAAVRADFPGNSQARLAGLGLPIQADQNAAGEIANGFGSILADQQRIGSFGFATGTEMGVAARLDGRFGADECRPTQDKGKGDNNPKPPAP